VPSKCLPILLVVTISISVACQPSRAQRGAVPPGFLLSATVPVSDDPNADNVGAPRAVLAELYAKTAATAFGMGYDWAKCEPKDPGDGPSKYVWPDRSNDPFMKIPNLERIVSFNIHNPWADALRKKDKARYWRLLERFITAAARDARENYGARYFRVPGNEPSLKSCTPNPVYKPEYPDWHYWYMDRAIHISKAIKAAHPDNQVIIGSLVVGDRAHVEALYVAGAKGHFDIIDIHAYGDAKTHVAMWQILETREVLEKHGDGDKKIMLSEGWSCFPLPKRLNGNLDAEHEYTPDEIEHYRQCLLAGWRNLMTPREGEYDPSWVIGATYFTFCDLWEGRGWRKRAKPVKDDKGRIIHYLVDGYPKRANELGPFFRPWGLVDLKGRPKGNLLEEFPPYIPKHKFTAEFVPPRRAKTAKAGQPYRIRLVLRNQEKTPMTGLRFAMYARAARGKKVEIQCEPAGKLTRTSIAPGLAALQTFSVVLPRKLAGKTVRLYGEAWFQWNGKPYYTDAWGPKVKVE